MSNARILGPAPSEAARAGAVRLPAVPAFGAKANAILALFR